MEQIINIEAILLTSNHERQLNLLRQITADVDQAHCSLQRQRSEMPQ
jgi:hypothetical protein